MSLNQPDTGRATLSSVSMAALPYLTLLGCAGVVWTIVLGFEEPHTRMLLVSGLLLAAAPLGLALHLALTKELTREDKRAWLAGIVGLKDAGLFGAYFTRTARRQATERLRAKAQNREDTNA